MHASVEDVSEWTGIARERICILEAGTEAPEGDEVLILADVYLKDFKHFISGDRPDEFDNSSILYRALGLELTAADARNIQEFLYLCENEQMLEEASDKRKREFHHAVVGTNFKHQGKTGAEALRAHLGIAPSEVLVNPYRCFRSIGVHIFRRKMDNSRISGLYVHHRQAGSCVLINYGEDVYRQIFTVCHECAHSIFDREDSAVVSGKWNGTDLREVRANAFAGQFLIPDGVVQQHLRPITWSETVFRTWCDRLSVNAKTLSIRLKESGIIDHAMAKRYGAIRINGQSKEDPEIPDEYTKSQRIRALSLLDQGLSGYYVRHGIEAFQQEKISFDRLSELFMVERIDLMSLLAEFQVAHSHGV